MATPDPSTHKEIVRRMVETANTGDLRAISDVIDEVVEPDVRNSTPLPVQATGAEALKQVWAMLLDAMPDLHVSLEELVAEGDAVAARNVVTGTHQGVLMGVPGTGVRLSYGEMFVFHFVNGRIAEISGIVDAASQMRQLGVLPAPDVAHSRA